MHVQLRFVSIAHDLRDIQHLVVLKVPRVIPTKHMVSHIQCRVEFWGEMGERGTFEGIRLIVDAFDKGVGKSIGQRFEEIGMCSFV